MERELATIRRITAIEPIEGADAIECCTVGGWKLVAQKGLYEVGSLAVYLEVDSWVPHTLAPFLTKPGKVPQVFNEVEGQRLKTIRLRGQISQGLLMPLAEAIEKCGCTSPLEEGSDVTEWLNIQKWEKPLSANLAGVARGNFPSFIQKTDQPRIQNQLKLLNKLMEDGHAFEVTEKLNGSSMTVYLNEETFGVCSRNLDLVETEGNSFWTAARKIDAESKLNLIRQAGIVNFAVQGELIGQGIQGNPYNISTDEVSRFCVYDIFNIDTQEYMLPEQVQSICEFAGFDTVPVEEDCFITSACGSDASHLVVQLLQDAEGFSRLNPKVQREGHVYKSLTDPTVSFKVISNKWLLKNDG